MTCCEHLPIAQLRAIPWLHDALIEVFLMLPTEIFPGYTTDGTSITIPLADMPGLTAAEADDLTGDGRKLAFELTRTIAEAYLAIPTADRPVGLSATIGTLQGLSATTARRQYSLSFDLDVSASDVIPLA